MTDARLIFTNRPTFTTARSRDFSNLSMVRKHTPPSSTMTSCLVIRVESLPAGLSRAAGWASRRMPYIDFIA
jgi:hypothetical protein